MVASMRHRQPSLEPRCTCGQLLTLPQVYLDLMFGDPVEECPDGVPQVPARADECLTES